MTEDWTADEAKKLATIARKHGLKCRVVRSKNRESYCNIVREEEEDSFREKLYAVLSEARNTGWDGFYQIEVA